VPTSTLDVYTSVRLLVLLLFLRLLSSTVFCRASPGPGVGAGARGAGEPETPSKNSPHSSVLVL
jgi:hypothetical protein